MSVGELEQLFFVIWREELVPRQWREGLISLRKGIKRTRVINPRRACARVTVVGLCVCVSVCYHVFSHIAQQDG